jgi:hypothetical protein
VRNEIMQMNTLSELKKQLSGIHEVYFEQFIVSVLSWYQYEVISPANKWETFDRRVISDYQPPNIFHLFEYPNLEAETIINQFIMSDAEFRQDEYPGLEFKQAKTDSIYAFNNVYKDVYDYMGHDVHLVLDAYRLFHCFQDDAMEKGVYYNQCLTEVW